MEPSRRSRGRRRARPGARCARSRSWSSLRLEPSRPRSRAVGVLRRRRAPVTSPVSRGARPRSGRVAAEEPDDELRRRADRRPRSWPTSPPAEEPPSRGSWPTSRSRPAAGGARPLADRHLVRARHGLVAPQHSRWASLERRRHPADWMSPALMSFCQFLASATFSDASVPRPSETGSGRPRKVNATSSPNRLECIVLTARARHDGQAPQVGHNRFETRMSTLVGMQLNGRYRLDAQIGTGGMSTVYRAFDSVLERRVAVKLMHREIAADTDQLERFRREARAVAQLSHPHIVGVIDAGEEDGRPYIVFEYVEGETLKDRIRRMGRLPVDEAIAYAIEISRALERRPRAPHRPSRRQAPERPDRRGGLGQGHRLRHRPLARRGGPDRRRARARDHRLRLARAGARATTSTASATSTRSASCCSRCSPATSRSTARTRSRWR